MNPLQKEVFAQLAEDGPNFPWFFDFPEPALNQALHKLKDDFDQEMKELPELCEDLSNVYDAVIICIHELFIEHNVPWNEVDERFERMGMGRYWQVLAKPYYQYPVSETSVNVLNLH